MKSITFTHVLHTPTLNANLISISAFDNAGLTTTFGNGRGVIKKPDGTVVLAGQGDKGMYIVETYVMIGHVASWHVHVFLFFLFFFLFLLLWIHVDY